jgi:S-adenosylmethionine decarboxylase
MIVGTEWLIEATGCNQAHLRDEELLRRLLEDVIRDLGLKSVGSVWHKFPGEAGVTGLIALTESHLACHTYPEHGTATFNLYCCRTRPEWNWDLNLKTILRAKSVSVSKIERGEGNVVIEISDLKLETGQTADDLRSKIQNPISKMATGGDA